MRFENSPTKELPHVELKLLDTDDGVKPGKSLFTIL